MKRNIVIAALVIAALVVAIISVVASEPPDYDHFVYLPIMSNNYGPPAPTPTPPYIRPTPTPPAPIPTEVLPTMRPTITPPGCCSCAGNVYNCSDFDTQSSAQACYEHCLSQGYGDVHHLDSDDDGIACEHLAVLSGG